MLTLRHVSLIFLLSAPQNITIFGSQAARAFSSSALESLAAGGDSRAAVAAKLVSLLRYFAGDFVEPKKLQILCTLGNTQDPVSVLHSFCQTCLLEQPKMDTHICEGLVSDGIFFQTVITVTDKHWGNKVITGEKFHSKTAAERSAAKKILNYFANKMFEEEIVPARA